MTALILDGFDHYGLGSSSTANMLNGSWAQVASATCSAAITPATGVGCLAVVPSPFNDGSVRRVLPTSSANVFASFRVYLPYLPVISPWQFPLFSWRDASNNILATIGVDTVGNIDVYTGSFGTLKGTSSTPVLTAGTWHFIECEYNTTTGAFTLRCDDATGTATPCLTATLNTGTNVAQIAFGNESNFTQDPPSPLVVYFDDLFVRNDQGTYNNGWLGDRRIATLLVDGEGTNQGWTPNYYEKFGIGVLQLATMQPNITTPVNPNSGISAAAATALDVGSSDFTLETWVRFEALPAATQYASIFSRWDATNNHRSYRLIYGGQTFNNGSLQFDISTDGTAATQATRIVYPWTPNLNTWYHIALCRSAGELLLFVNGQQFGLPIADSATYFGGGDEVLAIGCEASGTTSPSFVANTYFTGMFDETRFTNGVGRYTTSFSPPTSAFPRGSVADPDWSYVVLICGYEGAIIDESSYARVLSTLGSNAQVFEPSDGAAVGAYSTMNKLTPDDNTYVSAALTNATGVLTMTTQPANGNTVTVGTKNGSTAAVYTFNTTLGGAFSVLIDTTAQNTLLNLYNAINAGPGAGTKYGTGTTSNYDVNAVQLPAGQIEVVANLAGTGGNSIASTSTGTAATWGSSTLTGGANIPGPSDFIVQRPPNNTTIVSAVAMTVRALKSDSGTSTIQDTLVGGLGGTESGSSHALSVSPTYYTDIFEQDPDTMAQITPTTIVNGKFRINRTA